LRIPPPVQQYHTYLLTYLLLTQRVPGNELPDNDSFSHGLSGLEELRKADELSAHGYGNVSFTYAYLMCSSHDSNITRSLRVIKKLLNYQWATNLIATSAAAAAMLCCCYVGGKTKWREFTPLKAGSH